MHSLINEKEGMNFKKSKDMDMVGFGGRKRIGNIIMSKIKKNYIG